MIARIEAGSPDGAMTEIDVEAIVRDVGELYEPVAEETGVELVVDAAPQPIVIKASRELLGQALANLIDNAIKYGAPETGQARIAISSAREGETLVLRVADNGPGIPEADRERARCSDSCGWRRAERSRAAASD